jgi:hypothetical protein
MVILNLRTVLCTSLITWILLVVVSRSTVAASLCQTVTVSSAYPHQAFPAQPLQVITSVAGSCTSDGEDYFSIRVDLLNGSSRSLLSSNSTPIGYNANNFSAKVENGVTAPSGNQTWPIEVDTYLIQAGGLSGTSLLNATTLTIQVGDTSLPEFPINYSFILLFALTATTLTLYRHKLQEW